MSFDRFGSGSFGSFGTGGYVREYPTLLWQRWQDFGGGYVSSNTREEVPPNASPNSIDFEVDNRDRLVPVPGTSLYATEAGRLVRQMIVQASLDNTSELILLAPPFIGIKSSGSTQWFDASLPTTDRRYTYTNFGGTLLFGNGIVGMYAHEFGKQTVELIDKAPAAVDYLSFAGRVFAFGAVISGNREALGVSWSAVNSDYKDWDGLGSGAELLIDDMSSGDRIVAARSMGLDAMAILLRNSIWVARRVNLRDRPADFRSAVPGVGAVASATVRTTRFGVLFLSDSGVYLFDGNGANLVSEQINGDLLPLDYGQLNLYRGLYNPLRKTYTLFTPTYTWVYELEKRRWTRRSIQALDSVLFAQQFPALTWDEMEGTWDAQTVTWDDTRPSEANLAEILYMQQAAPDTLIHREDLLSSSNFGIPMAPSWEMAKLDGQYINQILTTKRINVEYQGTGAVDLFIPNNEGDYTLLRNRPLPATIVPRTKVAFAEASGKGAGVRLTVTAGRPVISKIELGFLLRGQRIENTVFEPRDYYEDF